MPDAVTLAATRAADAATPRERALRAADLLLLASFFLSGASALAYQVGWQRALYGQLGVDIDSITIIVSVFMLGIGVGGMTGGWLADRLPRQRLRLYAAIELSIGAFGLASLVFLPWLVALLGAGANVAACFLFLLLPTVLMGTTLPLLTIEFDERRRNIGVSVGTLYFTNTLGAACGAALVPLVLLPQWTLPEVVRFAAFGNFTVIAFIAAAGAVTRRAA